MCLKGTACAGSCGGEHKRNSSTVLCKVLYGCVRSPVLKWLSKTFLEWIFFYFFLVTCFVFERVVMVEVDNMRKTLKNK